MNGKENKPWASLNWPNRISLLRLLFVAPFIILLVNRPEWTWARHAALGIFVGMSVSDYLDGLLARKLNQRTRLGAILDPLADKALIIFSVIILSAENWAVPGARIHNWVVVAVVGKDLWVILGFLVLYLVTDRFRVHPIMAGKLSTAGQLAMVVSVLLAPDLNRLGGSAGTVLAETLQWLVVALSVWAVIGYTRLGLQFVAEGQKPLDQNGPRKEVTPK